MLKEIYKVTVEVERYEEVVAGKDWVKGGNQDEPDKWAHNPEVIKTSKVRREIYTQTLENLDLVEVVKAVNKLPQ